MNISITINRRTVGFVAGLALLASMAATCGASSTSTQRAAQNVTQQVGKQLNVGGDYPLSQMHGMTQEQKNDRERLLRLNDPNKIGYLSVILANGQVLGYWTIKGKFSSTESALLNTQDISNCSNGKTSGDSCSVVDSLGDDGTYGGEECATNNGVFFFDVKNALHEVCPGSATVVYSDVPENYTTKPIVVENANEKPTSTAGQR